MVLVLTTITKRMFNRTRPAVPVGAKRMLDLRTKETNCSMPSGDTAQAGLLVFFLRFKFPLLYQLLGGDAFALRAILLVAFGRVFHHCHFFGDTFIGASIGFFVAS